MSVLFLPLFFCTFTLYPDTYFGPIHTDAKSKVKCGIREPVANLHGKMCGRPTSSRSISLHFHEICRKLWSNIRLTLPLRNPGSTSVNKAIRVCGVCEPHNSRSSACGKFSVQF